MKDGFQRMRAPTKDEAIQSVSFAVHREGTTFTHAGQTHKAGRDVLFRLDNEGKPVKLGHVSPDYKFVPHAEALTVAFEAIEKSNMPFVLKNVQLDRWGAKMFAQFQSSQGFEITPGNKGDTLFPILTLVNSYDGGNKLGFDLESERLVCLNLARAMSKDASLRFMHTLNASVEALTQAAQAGVVAFREKLVPFYRKLAETEVDKETAVKAVAVAVRDEVIPQNIAVFAKHCVDSDCAEQEGIKRTMWAVFNAFTWASTTRSGDLSPTRDREIRGKIGALFADGGQKLLAEAKAVKNAMEILKIAV
jgi:hypothetical protein